MTIRRWGRWLRGLPGRRRPDTYITVNVSPAAGKGTLDREVIAAIRACEQRSGTRWRR